MTDQQETKLIPVHDALMLELPEERIDDEVFQDLMDRFLSDEDGNVDELAAEAEREIAPFEGSWTLFRACVKRLAPEKFPSRWADPAVDQLIERFKASDEAEAAE